MVSSDGSPITVRVPDAAIKAVTEDRNPPNHLTKSLTIKSNTLKRSGKCVIDLKYHPDPEVEKEVQGRIEKKPA